MPAGWPDASTFGWLMFAVVSPTRLHKSKGALTSANPFLAAHLSFSFSFYTPIHSVRRRGCVIKSVDDRRERIKYRTGRAHRLSSKGWKRWEVNERARASSPRLLTIQICFLPFFAVPQPPRRLCVPGRLFFAYYSLLRGYWRACFWQFRRGYCNFGRQHVGQECFILGLGISSFITKGDKICEWKCWSLLENLRLIGMFKSKIYIWDNF